MIVTQLKFKGFRNLKDGCINPSDGINIIYGDNAQGKTNLLECIWLFNGVRSFRGSKDNELISFEEKFASINMEFFSDERLQNAQINILNGKRQAIINGVTKNAPSHLIGKFCSIVFSPEHLMLVKSGPSERRKFIDGAICQIYPKYAIYLSKYNKLLNQRNALLKEINKNKDLMTTLDIWDEKLCIAGAEIIERRIKYIELLKEKAGEFHNGISENKETLELSYNSNLKNLNNSEIAKELYNGLKKRRREDMFLGHTSVGPHRDDIDIILNGKTAKTFASQGQQRSIVLSLKLSEAVLLYETIGEKPVILLDDVLSELDAFRQDFLINKIFGWQVFITCCEKNIINKLKSGKIFKIENGNVITEE